MAGLIEEAATAQLASNKADSGGGNHT